MTMPERQSVRLNETVGGAVALTGVAADPGCWERVKDRLAQAVGEGAYDAYYSGMHFQGEVAGKLVLGVRTAFIRNWFMEEGRLGVLVETFRAELGRPVDVSVVVSPVFGSMVTPTVAKAEVVMLPDAVNSEPLAAVQPEWLQGTKLDPRYTFETFVTGNSNQFAFAAAQRVAGDGGKEFNPFFIHGGVGLGKTHLMHAIGWEIGAQRPGAVVRYLSSEQFLQTFIRALRERDMQGFKDAMRQVDVLMIDDIQFIAGKDNTQQEFFDTFNALVSSGKQVILTADKSPHELANIEDRLRSRLGAGLTVEVHPPAVETRLAILQKKAADMQLEIGDDVLDMLAKHIASNVRELEGALNRLAAFARLTGAKLTPDFVREQLRDLFRANQRTITMDDIQTKVAEHFNLRLADLHGPRRNREVARPRQIAMYLCKTLTTRSYPDIGRLFGGRDHTTVMHAVEQIENLKEKDRELAENVRLLEKMLTAR